MSIFKPVKTADGFLAPTFEGVQTVEVYEAAKAAHQAANQAKVNARICQLQDEAPDLQDLIRRHAAALVEIDRLKGSLHATGGALIDAALVSQKIGQQNEVTSVKKRQANARHAKSNAAWVKVYQWLEANKDDATLMTNEKAALSVPDNLVGIDKAVKRPLTLDSVSRAIGKWKNGKWDKPTN